MSDKNINVPQIGMSFIHPSLLKDGQFSLLLNGSIQNVSGNFMMITNESSNILATRFKENFKVIGTSIVPSLRITLFFITNPATNESEIGFLFDASSPDVPDAVTTEGKIIESIPLEQTTQLPLSVYNTFVNANCLNFDIDHPITSWVKIDDCNVRIYFNDFKNVPRYIDYKNFPKIDLSNCPLIETDQLDCDKIKIFPESCYPVTEVVDVVSGGQNPAGVYQFTIAYSDVRSNKLTDYFYVTNPLPLFDQPITIPTDYPVNKSFKLRISNLNTDFKYFNLVVIRTINNVPTPYLIDTFEVNSSIFEYIYTGNEKNIQTDLSIDEIIVKNPIYNKAKGTTESNGYLFLYNLEEDRILNLQPVVNEIDPFWQTVEMNDGDYLNPIIAQNYVGFLGDEIYPLGIAFTKINTKQTNVFPLIGREATENDLESVCEAATPSGVCTNPDVIVNSSCDTEIRDLRWQVYNTASFIDNVICVTTPPSGVATVEITDEVDCQSDQILMNSIQSYDPVTGDIVYTTTPIFWEYPPDNIPYPPQGSTEAQQLYTDYLNIPANRLNNIQNDQTEQERIDLCNCEDLLVNYPPDATVVTEPIIIDPYVDNSSIEIIQEETIVTSNTYDASVIPEIPNPAGYPYTPSPCLNYATAENDLEKGYVGWLQAKLNISPASADTIVQNDTAQCSDIATWGAFISDDENPNTPSWYQFYVNNQDGAVGIILSTDKTSNNGSQNNASFEVYEVTSTNSQGAMVYPTNTTANPITIYRVSNNDGESAIIVGLQPNVSYFIKVIGDYPKPVDLLGVSCKRRSFKLCVVTPSPATSTSIIVPGIARIVKNCVFTYQGIPQSSCEPQPDKYGTFAYTESQETYPCNEEVYGIYAGKPIRHFKFPDHNVVSFFEQKGSTPNNLTTKLNKIYPKGVRIDIQQIKFALNKAVNLGLITQEERDQICGYRIYRGNRRGNESIIAKGLLYDIWDYKDNIYNTGNKILFPNFPFNDNNPNIFIKNKQVKNQLKAIDQDYLRHPFQADLKNNKYTLDAPNLSFNNPSLGTELKVEFEQVGNSIGNFNELKNNSKYQYIGPGIISAAIGFASVEAAFEALDVMVKATLTLPITVLGSGTSIPLGLILALIGENILAPVRMYSHYAEWYEIIKKFAPFRNYGTTYSGVGKYVEYVNNDPTNLNTRRAIANTQYIKPGILNVKTIKGNTRLNNFKRDSSVFIELAQDSFFAPTQIPDESRNLPATCTSTGVTGTISSYYASLKNLQLSQYGQIDNIEWIDTGYNGRIDWNNPDQNTDCDTIFGGDTYISRFTKKRKTPLFLDDRVIPSTATTVATINQDIQMSLLPNIGYPRFFMDYPTALDYTGIANGLFGDVAVLNKTRADYNFYCFSSDGQTWKDTGLAAAILGSFAGISFGVASLPIAVTIISVGVKRDLGNDLFLKGKYVHSMYGITSFLCESNYNLDLRHGENLKEKNFYPNVGDTNEWTQESFIPISQDNTYIYNNDYSKQNKENPNFILNNDFKQTKEDCKVQHPNRVIYSLQDNDQDDKFDGNLNFPANNRYEFPKSGGRLQIVKGINSGVVLAIQENQASAFNSFISLQTNIGTPIVGSNSLFNNSIPTQYVKTDLGFGGSQTPAITSTEFGTYWVDNKRGQILEYNNNIQNIVKPEEEWWFKENLPFHILEDFPDFDITNNYKYIGMTLDFDAKNKLIIIGKRDVELLPQYKNNGVTYDGTFFNFNGEQFTVESDKYFCSKSWTISYSPILKSFISFHSYLPNYIIGNQNYFSTGYNYPINSLQTGSELYYHNLTNKSYGVYGGVLYPFIFQYSIPTKYENKMLESVRYEAEFYRFQDNNNSGLIPNITYNKFLTFNQKQSSGLIELVPKIKNNRQQFLQYPKQNLDSRSILVEYVERGWNINNFYDVSIENSGQPLLYYTCNNIAYPEINPLSISYRPQHLKKKMVSDYAVLRFINDNKSNYSILHRFSLNQTNDINK